MSTTEEPPEQVGIEDARKNLGDLVNRVAYRGERIVITRQGKPVADLVPHREDAKINEQEA